MDTTRVCVIVPAYNEATTIGTVVSDLCQRFASVVCVDDGSDDCTGDLAAAAGAAVVRHPLNLGQGAALQTGFDYVQRRRHVEWLVTFDADGQHLVDDAVRMLEVAVDTGAKVVLASRFRGTTENMPWSRRMILQAAIKFTRWTTGLDVTDAHNGLRVISADVLDQLRLTHAGMAYASELTSAIGRHELNYAEVPTRVLYSEYSRGKGQRNLNAVNILFDLATARLRAAP
jgi:polyprenyl-phospho-N-acetylgalactosaminyl synthase